jgi:hypothetical protein
MTPQTRCFRFEDRQILPLVQDRDGVSTLTALLALASGDTRRGVIARQTPLRGAKTRENEIEDRNQSY